MLRYSPQQERNRRCEPIESIAQLSSPATTRCAHATVAIGRPIETNVNSLKSLRRDTAQPGKVLAPFRGRCLRELSHALLPG